MRKEIKVEVIYISPSTMTRDSKESPGGNEKLEKVHYTIKGVCVVDVNNKDYKFNCT